MIASGKSTWVGGAGEVYLRTDEPDVDQLLRTAIADDLVLPLADPRGGTRSVVVIGFIGVEFVLVLSEGHK